MLINLLQIIKKMLVIITPVEVDSKLFRGNPNLIPPKNFQLLTMTIKSVWSVIYCP